MFELRPGGNPLHTASCSSKKDPGHKWKEQRRREEGTDESRKAVKSNYYIKHRGRTPKEERRTRVNPGEPAEPWVKRETGTWRGKTRTNPPLTMSPYPRRSPEHSRTPVITFPLLSVQTAPSQQQESDPGRWTSQAHTEYLNAPHHLLYRCQCRCQLALLPNHLLGS
ncbi:hypothetical protein DPEC_G00264010 [Dallia pectoralis]|uniref:Uncharacterized protein n=1 Tax=Dallia pectoralis TaxID=75939 RepID=A0ACC2FSI1_DALPE|nr:hypothetical protein DPEC_G00264010 [Dallia pectoralis]